MYVYLKLWELKKLEGRVYIQEDGEWVRVVKKHFFAYLSENYHHVTRFKVMLNTEDKEVYYFGAANA